MAEIGSVIAGKYEILTEIGHGGMSVVYLAMDTHLNKQWAVKEIRKKGNGRNDEVIVNSLLAEANMMKRLDHPSLPRIVDIIDNGVTIFVVMDYIEGESLDKILAEYGAQPEELVVGWAKQLCDALSYLHSQKPPIIYRDMKPANVMLKPEGNIKIIDFGIAREYKEQNLADTTVLGTKGYAPPEQYSGQTDARSDIFALGMTMHHLLTGIDPRTGEAYAPVRMWNPEVSEGVEMIIDKCVQPAPENRYQNCQDLLYDLEHPELITRDYKKKQKIKLNSFVASIVLAIVCVISGVVCNRVSVNMNNGDYEVLVSTSTASSLDEKISNYKKAIDIYPMRTDAYFKMIEAYEDEGKFGKNENDTFLAVYNAHKDEFDNTTKEVAELNYKIGMMYFNYYTEEDGSYSFSTRTGYQTDEVGDLYYAQARRYDASVGRFVSEDKVRGFVILPYTLNHYGYCWNNPVDFVDRDGNLPTVVIGAVIGLAAGALGEVVSQTIDGVQSGKSVLDSLLDVNPGKVVLEAGKGAVTGAVAGTGAGLLVVAGTSGVVEFGGDLLDQKVLQKKEDLDYTHAISNGLWSATTTLVVGGITNEISNVIHPEAKTGTMDYLFGRDKAKAVVKAQYNNARSSSSRAKYWNRLEKIKLQKTLGTIKYGIIETGKTIIDEIKNEIYRDEVNEDIVEEIDKKISCSVY